MSKTGSGRGRGWLKLNQSTEPVRPGTEIAQQSDVEKSPYDELIVLMNVLDTADDGISLNNKLRHITENLNKLRPSDEDLIKVSEKCLEDDKFSEKFLMFITSAYIDKSKEEFLKGFRWLFVNQLQQNFLKKDVLRKTSPTMFRKSVMLFSNYFKKIRRLNFMLLSIEGQATPGYMETLLNHAESDDLNMLTTLVCEHSKSLIKMLDLNDETLLNVLNKIKLVIVTNEKLSSSQKMLLFFNLDLITQKFDLRSDQLTFYKNHLDNDDIKNILIKYKSVHKLQFEEISNGNMMSEIPESQDQKIEQTSTHEIKFKSHINCQQPYDTAIQNSGNLQNDSLDSGIEEPISKPFKSFNVNDDARFSTDNVSQMQRNQMGRPILGVGARLKRK